MTQPEKDETEDLSLMPRAVRDKLDQVGFKVHLREWQLLSMENRQKLCTLPCESSADIEGYGKFVEELVVAATGKVPDRLQR